MANNLYLVNTQDGEGGWVPIVAASRGQARGYYLRSFCGGDDFTAPLSIQILAHDVEGGVGADWSVSDEIYFETVDEEWWDMQRADLSRKTRHGRKECYYGG